jgi:hypothetical protein
MREITAKFTSTCPATGLTIRKGSPCFYDPSLRKAYHPSAEYLLTKDVDDMAAYVQAEQDAYFDSFCQANNI